MLVAGPRDAGRNRKFHPVAWEKAKGAVMYPFKRRFFVKPFHIGLTFGGRDFFSIEACVWRRQGGAGVGAIALIRPRVRKIRHIESQGLASLVRLYIIPATGYIYR